MINNDRTRILERIDLTVTKLEIIRSKLAAWVPADTEAIDCTLDELEKVVLVLRALAD